MTTHALATVRKVSRLWLLVLLGSGLPSLLAELTGADRFAVGTAQIVLHVVGQQRHGLLGVVGVAHL